MKSLQSVRPEPVFDSGSALLRGGAGTRRWRCGIVGPGNSGRSSAIPRRGSTGAGRDVGWLCGLQRASVGVLRIGCRVRPARSIWRYWRLRRRGARVCVGYRRCCHAEHGDGRRCQEHSHRANPSFVACEKQRTSARQCSRSSAVQATTRDESSGSGGRPSAGGPNRFFARLTLPDLSGRIRSTNSTSSLMTSEIPSLASDWLT